MKNLILLSMVIASIAQAEDVKPEPKILYYQKSATVRVGISNDTCSHEPTKATLPWAAIQMFINPETGDILESVIGCYGPASEHDIQFKWKYGESYTLPANAFLLPQGRFDQEVPKIPELPRIDI